MSPEERAAIREANRPPHGKADRTVSALLAEVERLEALFEAETDHRISAVESTRRAEAERDEARNNADFARRNTRRFMAERDAALADAARLRAALQGIMENTMPATDAHEIARAALGTAPAGDDALRELLFDMVAKVLGYKRDAEGDRVATKWVDAVLRGER